MNVLLKLTPFISDDYSLEKRLLRFPVHFSYESAEGNFVNNITEGLPINGRFCLETQEMQYFIGDSCSLEQLATFINGLSRGITSTITFSETEDAINTIIYDPMSLVWTHKTGSKVANYGSTLTIKLSHETFLEFRRAFENYRKLAFMTIEGHKRLAIEDDEPM